MNGYLLDTHVFIWVATSPEKLSSFVRQKVESLESVLYVSAASVWEIAQKRALGKLRFDADISTSMARHSLSELPVRGVHCEAAAELPLHHKDPFDRLLIAQASLENLVLLSSDKIIALLAPF